MCVERALCSTSTLGEHSTNGLMGAATTPISGQRPPCRACSPSLIHSGSKCADLLFSV